jgi:hypothetical protein
MNPLWLLPVGAALCGALILARGKWDLIAEHARDMLRHALAAVLMLGTLTATSATFSNGRIHLAGPQEMILSVLGITLALEIGAIYLGWFNGVLEQRLLTAKRDLRAQLEQRRREVRGWFFVICGISGIANLVYRVPLFVGAERGAAMVLPFALALFISACPCALIYAFMIVMRPLPEDYKEKARRGAGRAQVKLVAVAERNVMRFINHTGNGRQASPQQLAAVKLSVYMLAANMSASEGNALHTALLPQGAADPAAVYVDSSDLVARYGISERAAQYWIADCLDARPTADGSRKEAPLSSIEAAHGRPKPRRKRAQSAAMVPQIVDADPQPAAS